MHVFSRLLRKGLRARWLIGLVAAMVTLPVLMVASAADAAGPPWTIQTTANPGTFNELAGVSCPSATTCAAAGFDFVGKNDAMSQIWNGTAWQIPFLVKGDPLFSATHSFLYGASCPTATKCEMVGNYQSGANLPLAVLWNGKLGRVSVSSQPMEVPPGATYTQMNGVSCLSVSACIAVGFYDDSAGEHSLAEQWDGSRWARQPSATTHGAFNAVSCTSLKFCVAVGRSGLGQLAETWNGSTWAFSLGGIWNGATLNTLNGVSCTADEACIAVGFISYPPFGTSTLGVQRTTTGTWKLLNTSNPSATGNALYGVSCPPNGGCLAVGYYQDSRGVNDTLAEHWSGLNWSMEVTPVPIAGSPSFLLGASCSSADTCTAVGIYKDLKGNTLTLAERFVSAGSPHGFSLTRSGTVLALLRKPRTLGLLVFQLGRHGHLLGLVPLGNHPRGLSRIRWNLRVSGKRLRAGTYTAELVATFGRGVTSDGPSVTFDLTRAGLVRVRSATCSVAAAQRGRC